MCRSSYASPLRVVASSQSERTSVRKGGKGGSQWYAPEAGRLFPTRAAAIRANEEAYATTQGGERSAEGDAGAHGRTARWGLP